MIKTMATLLLSLAMLCSGGVAPAAGKRVLKCGDIITSTQLEKVLATQVVFDAASKPVCRIKAQKGIANGSVQVFQGAADTKYAQMAAGAKASLASKGKFNTSGSTGKKSFEFAGKMYGMDMVEIGFLDSSGRFAVLITLGVNWAKLENARKLATAIDANLKKLK